MGLGDAKLAFLIGLFLGPVSAAAALMSAFIIGAVFGIILLALGVKNLKSQIAFGPFLVLGAAIVFFFFDFTPAPAVHARSVGHRRLFLS